MSTDFIRENAAVEEEFEEEFEDEDELDEDEDEEEEEEEEDEFPAMYEAERDRFYARLKEIYAMSDEEKIKLGMYLMDSDPGFVGSERYYETAEAQEDFMDALCRFDDKFWMDWNLEQRVDIWGYVDGYDLDSLEASAKRIRSESEVEPGSEEGKKKVAEAAVELAEAIVGNWLEVLWDENREDYGDLSEPYDYFEKYAREIFTSSWMEQPLETGLKFFWTA